VVRACASENEIETEIEAEIETEIELKQSQSSLAKCLSCLTN